MQDHYAVLEISATASADTIKASYKRLARERHPDRDRGNPKATANFQLLLAAYEILSDPVKKRDYDRTRPSTFASGGPPPYTPTDATTASSDAEKAHQRQEAAKKVIDRLEEQKATAERGLFDLARKMRQLNSSIRQSREADKEDDTKDAQQASVLTYFNIWGTRETSEEKDRRKRARIDRAASQRIWQTNLESVTKQHAATKQKVEALDAHIAKEYKNYHEAVRDELNASQRQREAEAAKERARAEAEAAERTRAWKAAFEADQELRARREAAAKQQEEREALAKEALEKAKRNREAQAAQREKREKAERNRKAQQEREARERAERNKPHQQNQKPTQAGAKQTARDRVPPPQHVWGSCNHRAFWSKEFGAFTCSECDVEQRRFIFRCPKCQVIACADCMRVLKKK